MSGVGGFRSLGIHIYVLYFQLVVRGVGGLRGLEFISIYVLNLQITEIQTIICVDYLVLKIYFDIGFGGGGGGGGGLWKTCLWRPGAAPKPPP